MGIGKEILSLVSRKILGPLLRGAGVGDKAMHWGLGR